MNYKMILAAVVAVVCVSGLYASKQTKKSTVNPNFVATIAQNQQNTQSSQSQSSANPNGMLFRCPFNNPVTRVKTIEEKVTVITCFNEYVISGTLLPIKITEPVNQFIIAQMNEEVSFTEGAQNGSSSSSQQQVQQPQQNNLNIQNNGLNTQSTQQPQQNRQRRPVLPMMQLDFNGGPNGFGVFNKK